MYLHLYLYFVTAPTWLNGGQPNFALCLADSWADTLYIHFARCKINFASKSCLLIYWQRYCTVLDQLASGKLCDVQQRAPPIFGRAAITMGIVPHSSFCFYSSASLSRIRLLLHLCCSPKSETLRLYIMYAHCTMSVLNCSVRWWAKDGRMADTDIPGETTEGPWHIVITQLFLQILTSSQSAELL